MYSRLSLGFRVMCLKCNLSEQNYVTKCLSSRTGGIGVDVNDCLWIK